MLGLASVLLLTLPAQSAAVHEGASGAALDIRLERTPVIVETDYLALPRMDADGAMGRNARDDAFSSLADQRLGDLYVRAGIVHDRPDLISQGFKAFDYAFARQRSNGSWPNISQPSEEYAYFVEAVSHSGLLLAQTKYGAKYRSKLSNYKRRIGRALPHMVTSSAWSGFKTRNASYTHSGYTVGTALGLGGNFAGTEAFRTYEREAIRLALSRQWSDGVNPELGGYDVRYQMVGVEYAERYNVYFAGGSLAPAVSSMVDLAVAWQAGRVDEDGWIDWTGSTRACRELSSTGRPKTPGYPFTIRGFAYWGALRHRDPLLADARLVKRYLDAFDGDSLCGPKQTPPAAATAQQEAEPPVGGRLGRVRAQELFE